MLTKIYPRNPSERELRKVVAALECGGIVVYPTDGVYAFGCSLGAPKTVDRLLGLRGKERREATLVFDGIARLAEYCRVDNAAFRVLKRNLPGPFTFLLPASSRVPDRALSRRKTIGAHIPANPIARAIVEMLAAPLVSVSVKDEQTEYTTDPELIDERYGRTVALVVDGGMGEASFTTVVDLTDGEPVLLREGRGELR